MSLPALPTVGDASGISREWISRPWRSGYLSAMHIIMGERIMIRFPYYVGQKLVQASSAAGCSALFLPECFSFIGTSQPDSLKAAQVIGE